jgi:hypothetical protein
MDRMVVAQGFKRLLRSCDPEQPLHGCFQELFVVRGTACSNPLLIRKLDATDVLERLRAKGGILEGLQQVMAKC